MTERTAAAGRAEPPATPTQCPACGSDTEITRDVEPRLVSLARDELETLVRNEWRRRAGADAYGRSHPHSLVRALIDFALDPQSPSAGDAVESLLWEEVATLQAWGLSRSRMSEELLRLSQAMWDVLSFTELDLDRAQALMCRMDDKIFGTLEWPGRPPSEEGKP